MTSISFKNSASIVLAVFVFLALALTPFVSRAADPDQATVEAAQQKLQELQAILQSLLNGVSSSGGNSSGSSSGGNVFIYLNPYATGQGTTGTSTVVSLEGGNSDEEYQVGAVVRVTNTLNVRDGASVSAALKGTQLSGATGMIKSGPVDKDGYRWYEIDYTLGVDGWSAANWLEKLTVSDPGNSNGQPSACTLVARLMQKGMHIVTTDNVNVRSDATTTAAILGVQTKGSTGVVEDSYDFGHCVDPYFWVKINYDNGLEGWTYTQYVKPTDEVIATSSDKGTLIITYASNNRTKSVSKLTRERALARCQTEVDNSDDQLKCTWKDETIYESSAITTHSEGNGLSCDSFTASTTKLPTGSGKVTFSWKTTGATGVTLWRIGDANNLGSTADGYKPHLQPDDSTTVSVSGTQRFSLSLWNSESKTLTCPEIKVVDTSAAADNGTNTTDAPGLAKGDRVHATDRVNVRVAPNTFALLTYVQSDTTVLGTVTAGPQTADGYTWVNVDWDRGGDGWVATNWLAKASAKDEPVHDLKVYKDGKLFGATYKDVVRDKALQICINVTNENKSAGITCLWDDQWLPVIPLANSYTVDTHSNDDNGNTAADTEESGDSTQSTNTKFYMGDLVRVNSALNVRSAAGISSALLYPLSSSIRWVGTIYGGPVKKDGYEWVHVDWEVGASDGWVVTDGLDNITADDSVKSTLKIWHDNTLFKQVDNVNRPDAITQCFTAYSATRTDFTSVTCNWDNHQLIPTASQFRS